MALFIFEPSLLRDTPGFCISSYLAEHPGPSRAAKNNPQVHFTYAPRHASESPNFNLTEDQYARQHQELQGVDVCQNGQVVTSLRL